MAYRSQPVFGSSSSWSSEVSYFDFYQIGDAERHRAPLIRHESVIQDTVSVLDAVKAHPFAYATHAEADGSGVSYTTGSHSWQNYHHDLGDNDAANFSYNTAANDLSAGSPHGLDGGWTSSGRASLSYSTSNGYDIPPHRPSLTETTSYTTSASPYNHMGGLSPSAFPSDSASSVGAENSTRHASVPNTQFIGHSQKPSSSSSSSRKTKRQLPMSPASNASTTTTGNKSKLRSASRTSKNTHHNPPATEEERKNRESHNQVEKQYRNRLNAQFELLLGVLPSELRASSEDGDSNEMSTGDRKVSKAEVLEMAKRYIQNLEGSLEATEGERDALRDDLEKRRWYCQCANGDGHGMGGAAAASDIGKGVDLAQVTSRRYTST
ncbi:helix-loop-helix DNA-binding domain-containing protein [Apiospora arundinis]